MRVLYVEDDDNLAFAVEKMLSQAGHVCDRARSGAGAVKLGQEDEYDVILLDVMLPDIDGYEVLRQLQEVGVETPVLIQSGLVERDRSMDGLGFGVDDYLIKPFNRDELLSQVEKAAARGERATPAATLDSLPEILAIGPPPADSSAPEPQVIQLPAPEPQMPEPPVPEPPGTDLPVPDLPAPEPLDLEPPAPEPPVPEPLDLDLAPTEQPMDGETEIPTPTTDVPAVDTSPPADSAASQLSDDPAAEPPAPDASAAQGPPLPSACPELPARIVGSDSEQPIDCTIVSLSSGGAVLDVYDETVDCPDVFMLAVVGDKSYRCESCWRHAGKIGVKFA